MTEARWPRRTRSLELRLPSAADIDELLTWRNHPEVSRWLLRTQVDPDAYRAAWLDTPADSLDQGVVAALDGGVIGTVTLAVVDEMGQPQPEARQPDGTEPWHQAHGRLGYLIAPGARGRGLASEMIAAMLEVAFDDLGLHRVSGGCFDDNTGSWRVMEKCGMRREQHGVQDSWHADLGWVDGFTYAVLAQEWRAARPRA